MSSKQDPEILSEWKQVQVELSQLVTIPADDVSSTSAFDAAIAAPAGLLVAGCDVSFFPNDAAKAVASLVVCDFAALDKVVWELHLPIQLTEPYIPQFLSFRELPGLLTVWHRFTSERPDLAARVLALMLDGNGILHPRRLGIASHLGVVINMPTIGCAKSLLWLPGFPSEKELRRSFVEQALPCHATVPLRTEAGDQVGVALRATEDSNRPIFVSPGHSISMADAIKVVIHTTLFRVPEPIRKADLNGRQAIRDAAR